MLRRWAAVDLLAVLVFVVIGRSVHDHGINVAGIASTAWPFAAGLAVGWLAVVTARRPGTSLLDGVIVSVCTVAIGMSLRAISDQGVAVAFVVVALGFLGACMLGWRAVLGLLRRLHAKHAAA